MSERVTIPLTDGRMPADLWLPEGAEGPGVVLVQEIFGVSPYIRQRAADLADLGYVVLVPHLFWRLGVTSVPNGPEMLGQGMDLASRFDWETGVTDTVAALRALRERPSVIGRAGLLGFCFGGGMAFNVAAVDAPDALVAYYGSALPDLLHLAPQLTAPALFHFGTADGYLDPEKVARITEAVEANGARVELHEGADHAFDNPDFVNYHAEASAAAWQQTTAFLREHLAR
ncbi:dienelactone hydrolase family protein [Isoptericola sp. b441]|uniref:Dienelactone hydrolase family protein n=1 Tax=Actinotalea lenta TaxID=3064654 RepID=A0ABT9D9F7_9CELL|nr:MULTISPECIES: dienelactone hydrolase family protein [unclassified Isoptericola]MDO8107538.1 dienelactone hydrolase family protein [Isoptericola sp. b441]MDO8120802.1 dienelactone hydrolase family protein [Isoptericola sp. b490]